MTDQTGDYFTMTGEHYEDGRHVLTSTRTQPGRYGGDLERQPTGDGSPGA